MRGVFEKIRLKGVVVEREEKSRGDVEEVRTIAIPTTGSRSSA
jgi:hypothetical protein